MRLSFLSAELQPAGKEASDEEGSDRESLMRQYVCELGGGKVHWKKAAYGQEREGLWKYSVEKRPVNCRKNRDVQAG